MTNLGVAFIGTGMVAELHAQALRGIERARLVGCLGKERAETIRRSREWGIKPYDNYEQLLTDPEVNAVFVLTPQDCHHGHVLQALNAGRHVLVEKPVAITTAEINEMAEAAARNGLICMPGHNYIYDPEIIRAKRLLDEGCLGAPCVLWVNFVIYHAEELAAIYPGVLRQVMTHHFYLVQYLLGSPNRLFASKSRLHYQRLPQEDQVMIQLEMPGGALVSLFATFAANDETADPWTFKIKLLGINGGISYSWRSAVFSRPLGTLPTAIVPYEDTFAHEDRWFVEESIIGGKKPLSTLDDAARVLQLIEAAEHSIKTGCAVNLASDESKAAS